MQRIMKPNEMQRIVAAELARLLEDVGLPGFYGVATLILSLQDGHLQHLRVATERMVRPAKVKAANQDSR